MKILITGGAGFIGSNLAKVFLNDGHQVVLFDNLSRPGVWQNYRWLLENENKPTLFLGDVRDALKVERAAEGAQVIFHFASQVGVQASIDNPRLDFEVNALGTLNVLEAARKSKAQVIFASTNKVYGYSEDWKLGPLPRGLDENFRLASKHPMVAPRGRQTSIVLTTGVSTKSRPPHPPTYS